MNGPYTPLNDVLRDRRILDQDAARAELCALGLEVSPSQMARWASQRFLPFFLIGQRLFIQRGELHHALQKLQSAALRGEGRPRSRRRRH